VPIYEFRCHACSHVFDHLCKPDQDVASLECPECGGAVVRKFSLFRSAAFRAEPIEGDTTARTESGGGCSSCATQGCSTCSVL
jgi:putative FmdB family regulatory protein